MQIRANKGVLSLIESVDIGLAANVPPNPSAEGHGLCLGGAGLWYRSDSCSPSSWHGNRKADSGPRLYDVYDLIVVGGIYILNASFFVTKPLNETMFILDLLA
jgi:hypothetical protein